MKRKIIIVLIIGVICGGIIFALNSNAEEVTVNEIQKVTKLVEASQIEVGTHQVVIPVSGQLKSAHKVDLFAEVNGLLLNANFKAGHYFKKGEVIAQIKSDDLNSNLKAQKSGLLTLTAKLVADLKFDFPDAANEWDQFLDQLEINAPIPDYPEVQDKQLKLFVAGRNFFQTYYAVKSMEATLKKYAIIAPFDGFLSMANINPGSLVRGGQKIGEFNNSQLFEIKIDIPIELSNKIKIGDQIEMKSSSLTGLFNGQIVRINPVLDPTTQRISVFANIESTFLKEGMFLTGEIAMEEVENSFFIDRNLLKDETLPIIQQDELSFKKVNVIQIMEEKALVSGLSNGTLTLKTPIKGAYEGMKVRYEL